MIHSDFSHGAGERRLHHGACNTCEEALKKEIRSCQESLLIMDPLVVRCCFVYSHFIVVQSISYILY